MATKTTFWVRIELGNAAMETPDDVADALERTAATLRDKQFNLSDTSLTVGISDRNGATVGEWEVHEEGEDDG